MKKTAFLTCLLLLAAAATLVFAARATMTAPILKTSPEEITLTASFTSFEPASSYRIGVGSPGKRLQDYTMTIEQADKPLGLTEAAFEQGYMSAWFGLNSVQAKGYNFKGSMVNAEFRVTLQITMPRAEADRLGKLYIFVSKDYGDNTYYLEDGGEILRENWE